MISMQISNLIFEYLWWMHFEHENENENNFCLRFIIYNVILYVEQFCCTSEVYHGKSKTKEVKKINQSRKIHCIQSTLVMVC